MYKEDVDLPLILVMLLIFFISWVIFKSSLNGAELATQSPLLFKKPSESMERKKISTFLVLDVEGTCVPSIGFDWPNEIIEWPVVLLRWDESSKSDGCQRLTIVDEFHSFVRPTFQPKLHPFCTELTGITQEQVNSAPTFPEVLSSCKAFLIKNGVIDSEGNPLQTYIWCTEDGPWDLRDFFTKQAYISGIQRPSWIPYKILDVRKTFGEWYTQRYLRRFTKNSRHNGSFSINHSYKLSKQLELLNLTFEGREHSGIDDSRNIARVLIELSARGEPLDAANLDTRPIRKYSWMGPNGSITANF
ncbi:SubName: Full=Uncharacterized protein {ECO:0000313/EMBL:CCA66876.1} [Serendipita indica DSM 11827]|nr:SubName: Full=Uncharacterized protein {ECO:0000313/EMBL:CCA66876.1} [Serendipita indica DSM 11827]